MRKAMELVREVHIPLRELKPGEDFLWEPCQADQYTGPSGGIVCGPATWIEHNAQNAKTLAFMFLALFPMSLIKNIAEQMKKYVYDDWVVEEEEKGRNGNTKKIKVLVQCKENREGVRHHVGEDK